MKIGQLASEIFKFESVDDDGGRRRTDDGPLVYYKLTLWAFGSGELKNSKSTCTLNLDSYNISCSVNSSYMYFAENITIFG